MKESIKSFFNRYIVTPSGGLAQGLFASLLIGTILKTLGEQLLKVSNNEFFSFLYNAGLFAMDPHVVGAAMAVAVGLTLGCTPLTLFSLATVGSVCNTLGGAGGPLSVFLVVIIAGAIASLVAGRTKIDIILTPLVTIVVGVGLATLIAKPVGSFAMQLGHIIQWATHQHPLVMGVVISIVVGVALTLPISSAAICAAFSVTGLAGGAALAGCCANMVGFAVMSARDNSVGGFFSQFIGTSMLQMPNIIKNPKVWLPPIIASAITGPLSTCIFRLSLNGPAIASGMGTCGLVGPIGVLSGWASPSGEAVAAGLKLGQVVKAITPEPIDYIGLALISIILPGLITFFVAKGFRRAGWIKNGDLTLE